MTKRVLKLVETPHYHLWTDALHGRSLAHQARNEWDRGTYVRWSVTSAWTAFEAACEDGVGATGLGYRFKKNLDNAVRALSLPPLDWSGGVWQEVHNVHDLRRGFVHPSMPDPVLLPPTEVADRAIAALRLGIQRIYQYAGKTPPTWVEDDDDRGWELPPGTRFYGTRIHAGVERENPNNVSVKYVHDGKEHVSDILPPGSDPSPVINELLGNVRVPISAVRVYRGVELLEERELRMRGA